MSSDSDPDAPSALTPPPPQKLSYDVTWVESTFNRRKYADSLLLPEMDNGNLTRKDYEGLVAFVPGVRWKVDLLGFVTSGLTAGLWTWLKRPNKVLAAVGGYTLGETAGQVLRARAHAGYVQSLEDVNGFARAMENIKHKVGYRAGTFQIVRPLSATEREVEQSPFQPEPDAPYGESVPEFATTSASIPTSRPTPSSPSPAPSKSRWDEIRAARNANGPTKAWDNIRQGRKADGTPLPKPSERDHKTSSEPSPYRDDDRAIAQASFDAILERERKMGTSS
ncbi:hypothetical protein R3P38DRAFT_2821590 [Favolaschia claudopus]|uniref:Uncharacterized protein n=1 Tax=Favolaschia claudopus TaxID=2862362 RepID=A0AAW0EHC3_9AGAR